MIPYRRGASHRGRSPAGRLAGRGVQARTRTSLRQSCSVHLARYPELREPESGYWAVLSGYVEELTPLSEKTARCMYPFGSLHRAGAWLAFGSDWTVSTANPLLEIEVAVTRVSPKERDAEPFLPEERLDLPTALAAFTIGSAYVNHLDAETGSIEPGKLADLAVLDRNVFDPGAAPIGDARVVLMLVEGETVYAVGFA